MQRAKDMKAKQREELVKTLKARFEKNMIAIKVLNGLRYKQGWKLILKNCGHSMKWKVPAANRMLLVMITRRANTFFMIVQRKVLMAAEVFVTTVKRWSQEKNIDRKIALLIWRLPWALSFKGRTISGAAETWKFRY
jgi:hypothetical protein